MCIERNSESKEWVEQKLVYNGIPVTPLIFACIANQRESVEIILRQGVDVNVSSPQYGTALETACMQGLDEFIHLLLAHGAQLTRDCFLRMGGPHDRRIKCLELVSGHKEPSVDEQAQMIDRAIYDESPDLLEYLMNRGYPIEGDGDRLLPVHSAALYNSMGCLQRLVERGVNLNNRDYSGADIHATDRDGKTALHHAVSFAMFQEQVDSIDLIRLLLDRGIDPLKKDNFGFTAPRIVGLYEHQERIISVFTDRNIVEPTRSCCSLM